MGRTKDGGRKKSVDERHRKTEGKRSPDELEIVKMSTTRNTKPKNREEFRELTLDEQIQEVFAKFDKDGSGTIDVKELRHMLMLLGQNPTQAEVSAMVKQFDGNRNGQLDFNEFKQVIVTNLKDEETQEQELRNAFAVFDKDNSGFIDRQELAKVLRSTGEKLSKSEIDEVFRAMDTNGDGLINYEEFAFAMKND